MQAVRHVFKDIRSELNLAADPPVENFEPLEVKRYLMENHLKFCVLVVDAETVKDAYGKLTRQKVEYEDLLETAADVVGKTELFSPNERERVFPLGIQLDGVWGGSASTSTWSIRKLFVCVACG